MDGTSIGKWLVFAGLGIIILGLMIWIGTKIGIPLGKLPGDINMHSEKHRFYFPIVTSIVISIFLTIIINVLLWIFRK